ncbi:MAG: hypothetical protein QOH88_1091 [Verrucomicrobiota bacterium]|jgi:hypothetical protein
MRLCWRHRALHELDHELIWLAVSTGSMAVGTAWLTLGLTWPLCPFLSITGLPCVTCGATRSSMAFLHGDFLSALSWNPLVFFALVSLLVFDLYAAIVLMGRRPRLRIVDLGSAEKNVARIAVVSLLALNWIYLLAHRSRF